MNIYKMFAEGEDNSYRNMEFYKCEEVDPRLALMREMAKYIKDYLKLLKAVVNKLQVPEAAPLYKDMVAVESLLARYEEMEKGGV